MRQPSQREPVAYTRVAGRLRGPWRQGAVFCGVLRCSGGRWGLRLGMGLVGAQGIPSALETPDRCSASVPRTLGSMRPGDPRADNAPFRKLAALTIMRHASQLSSSRVRLRTSLRLLSVSPFTAPSPEQLASFRERYERSRRLVWGLAIAGFVGFIPVFVVWGGDHFTAFLACYGIFFVVQSGIALTVWRCPRCSLIFGRSWRIARCPECGLALEDRSRPAA